MSFCSWFNPDIHHRHSIRLKGYDYSSAGFYFLTLCTHRKACIFGHAADGQMHLSRLGEMIKAIWEEIPLFYASFEIGPFQVMPNHLHGIIRIVGEPLVNTQAQGRGQGPAPTGGGIARAQAQGRGQGPAPTVDGIARAQAQGRGQGPAPTIGGIVGRFKSLTAKRLRDAPVLRQQLIDGKLWRRDFYEHIIRTEDEYYQVRQYILENPMNWDTDDLRPS